MITIFNTRHCAWPPVGGAAFTAVVSQQGSEFFSWIDQDDSVWRNFLYLSGCSAFLQWKTCVRFMMDDDGRSAVVPLKGCSLKKKPVLGATGVII